MILSFQGTDIIGRPGAFVGMANYQRLFSDPGFVKVLGVTAAFTVLTVIPSIVGALVIALMLQQKIRAIRFFRTAFALPFAFSVATASVVFQVLYNPASGVLNGLLSYLGVDPVHWLTDPAIALFSVSLATVWMQIGYNLLVSQRRARRHGRGGAGGGAARRRVRAAAAALDRAAADHPAAVLPRRHGTIHSLQSFGQIRILTRGGPEGNTTTLVYSIFEQAFDYNNSNFGYASAQAMVLLLVVLVITAVQFGVLERKVFYR